MSQRTAEGGLGLGDQVGRDAPTQVGSDSDWLMVVSKSYSAYGFKRDGTLWTWGDDYSGVLGLGDRQDRDTPRQVGNDSDWAWSGCSTSGGVRNADPAQAWAY